MPENSGFVQCYRGMIGTLRLAPERSARQLEEILRRVGRLREQKPVEGSKTDRRTGQ